MTDDLVTKAATEASSGGVAAGAAALVTALGGSLAIVLRAVGAGRRITALANRVHALEERGRERDAEVDAIKSAVTAAAAAPASVRATSRTRVPASVDRRLDDLEAAQARLTLAIAEVRAEVAARSERTAGLIEGLTALMRGGRQQ